MGSVFEARHEVLGTTVALKFLHPELSRRSGLVQRFLQEAQVSAQIQSPHVVRVTDVDQNASGQAFIVMEYLEGKTLQTLYEELYHARQRLSYADALEYAMQMIEGVEAAHVAGVVHRDLKPDNVIITRGKKGEPLVKLLDFGIAKLKVTGQLDRGLTRPGIIMGTPEYMAPEQAYSADAVDARADIFSLGVMVFEMLAGRRPVGGDEPHQIATAYLTRNIAKLLDLAPHVPAELAAAIHRAMGPKPEDRFDSVADLRAAIEPFWLASRPAATPAPPGVSMLGLTPAPAPVAASPADGVRRVPKTLPPEDEAPAVAPAAAQLAFPAAAPAIGLAPSGGQSVEVIFSSQPAALQGGSPSSDGSSGPATTPTSKAPDFDQVGATPQPAEAAPSVVADNASAAANARAAFAVTASAAPLDFPGTVESPPLFAPPTKTNPGEPGLGAMDAPVMHGHQAATVDAPPITVGRNHSGTASMPMAMPERAGGTAVGAPMYGPGGHQGGSPYIASAAAMPATASMSPALPPTHRGGRSGRSPGASLALILLLAAGISGAVVGGVYYAQLRAKEQDRNDDPVTTTPPPATISSEPLPPPSSTVKAPPIPQPVVTARPPQTKPTSTSTAPAPSTDPSASPTGFPTSFPTTMPTIPTSIIQIPFPTAFPFPFPGQQAPGSQPSPQPSTTPTLNLPKPQPTSTGTSTSTRPSIIIKFPKKQD